MEVLDSFLCLVVVMETGEMVEKRRSLVGEVWLSEWERKARASAEQEDSVGLSLGRG